MPIAEAEEPAVGVSIIFERKPDAGSPHVRFDERGYGNVAMVEIETPTTGESRRQQITPQPQTKRASPRLHKSNAAPLDSNNHLRQKKFIPQFRNCYICFTSRRSPFLILIFPWCSGSTNQIGDLTFKLFFHLLLVIFIQLDIILGVGNFKVIKMYFSEKMLIKEVVLVHSQNLLWPQSVVKIFWNRPCSNLNWRYLHSNRLNHRLQRSKRLKFGDTNEATQTFVHFRFAKDNLLTPLYDSQANLM